MSCQNQDDDNTWGQKWWASHLISLLYQPGHTILRWQWCYPHLSHWERCESALTTFLLLISCPRPRLARSKGRELYFSWPPTALTLFLKDGQAHTAQLIAAKWGFCLKREKNYLYSTVLKHTLCPSLSTTDTQLSSQAGHELSLVNWEQLMCSGIALVLSARWRMMCTPAPALCQPQFPVTGAILQYPTGTTSWSFEWNHEKCQTTGKSKSRYQLFPCPRERTALVYRPAMEHRKSGARHASWAQL